MVSLPPVFSFEPKGFMGRLYILSTFTDLLMILYGKGFMGRLYILSTFTDDLDIFF